MANLVLISSRLPDLFSLRAHLWAVDSALSYCRGFSLSVHFLSPTVIHPSQYRGSGLCCLCPCPPALLHCGCLESQHDLLSSMAAPCRPRSSPCLTSISRPQSLSGCIPPITCSQQQLQSPAPACPSLILRTISRSHSFLLTSLPLFLPIPRGTLPLLP